MHSMVTISRGMEEDEVPVNSMRNEKGGSDVNRSGQVPNGWLPGFWVRKNEE